jgi:hypothetical protein
VVVFERDREKDYVVAHLLLQTVRSVFQPAERIQELFVSTTQVRNVDNLMVYSPRSRVNPPTRFLRFKVYHNYLVKDVLVCILPAKNNVVTLVDTRSVVFTRPNLRTECFHHLPLVSADLVDIYLRILTAILKFCFVFRNPSKKNQLFIVSRQCMSISCCW